MMCLGVPQLSYKSSEIIANAISNEIKTINEHSKSWKSTCFDHVIKRMHIRMHDKIATERKVSRLLGEKYNMRFKDIECANTHCIMKPKV